MIGQRKAKPTLFVLSGFPKRNFTARSYWSKIVITPLRGQVPLGGYPVGSLPALANMPPAALKPNKSKAIPPPIKRPQKASKSNAPADAITYHLL